MIILMHLFFSSLFFFGVAYSEHTSMVMGGIDLEPRSKIISLHKQLPIIASLLFFTDPQYPQPPTPLTAPTPPKW